MSSQTITNFAAFPTHNNSVHKIEKNDFETILHTATNTGASDIHFLPDGGIQFRVEDQLVPLNTTLSGEEMKELIFSFMKDSIKQKFGEEKEVDFSFTSKEGTRLRVNAFTSMGEVAAVARIVDATPKTVEELYLPSVLNRMTDARNGLIFISGATASGKTTTLAAMINHINMTKNKRIITIEDPVEIIHKNKKSVISQREVGEDTKNVGIALESALRQNPNVIVLGEIRSKEVAAIALQAAQTGILVFATIHASTASKTVERFCNLFGKDERTEIRKIFSETMQGIVAQRLITSHQKRRLPVIEIMTPSLRIREAIVNLSEEGNEKDVSLEEIIKQESINDMISIDQHLIELFNIGHIDKNVLIKEAVNEMWVRQHLQIQGIY